MSLLKKIILFFSIILMSFATTYALTLEGNIKLDEAKSTSLKISWDKVDEAVLYSVYYDTVSHADDHKYSHSLDNMIDGTGTTITDLKPDTNYYIAVRVIDGDGNEGDYSKEAEFTTKSLANLKIENVNVIDSNNITVSFNKDIDSSKDIEFKITEKKDNLSNIGIDSTEVDGNKVNIKLLDSLKSDTTYTLTVVSLTGINGEIIDAGVDGVIDFDTSDLNTSDQTGTTDQTDLNSASETGTTQTGTTKDESGAVLTSETGTTMSGTNLSNSDIKKTAELAGTKTKKLPKTGPETWILLVLALFLGFGFIKFRKQA